MSQQSNEPTKNKPYAVFLSYNSEDREAVEELAIYLQDRANLPPWLDRWKLIPGESWVENLERGLAESATCAIFVGQSGKGPWQEQEVKLALRYQVKNPHFRVIPVLLPDAPGQPELPPFLAGNMWVDFRKGLQDDDALWRLECGIRGVPPERGRPKPRSEEIPRKQQEIPESAQTKQPVEKMPRATDKAKPGRSKTKTGRQPRTKPEIGTTDFEQVEQQQRKEVKPAEVTLKKPQETPEQAQTKQPPERIPRAPLIRLRSQSLTVSKTDAQKVFKLNENWRPLEYTENDYEDQGEVVVDHATGLMWQKSGSGDYLTYEKAQAYIEQLNRERFASYTDWRLPTIEELMSLLEPEKQSNDLYINPIFDVKQRWCWSADTLPSTLWSRIRSAGPAWGVRFDYGYVYWPNLYDYSDVRAVRS